MKTALKATAASVLLVALTGCDKSGEIEIAQKIIEECPAQVGVSFTIGSFGAQEATFTCACDASEQSCKGFVLEGAE